MGLYSFKIIVKSITCFCKVFKLYIIPHPVQSYLVMSYLIVYEWGCMPVHAQCVTVQMLAHAHVQMVQCCVRLFLGRQNTHIHVHICAHMHACTCIHTHTCTHTHMRAHTYTLLHPREKRKVSFQRKLIHRSQLLPIQ